MAKLTENLPHPEFMNRRQRVAAVVSDMMTDLLYYDRKEDEELHVYAIEDAIIANEVSVDEILEVVSEALGSAVRDRSQS